MSRSWKGGSTTRWRKIRAKVLARDNYLCQIRIPGVCTQHATHVHHTKGKAITGDNPNFLVASCQACNLHIGDPTQQKHDPKPQPRSNW